jgi:hypothetical protein
MRHRVPGPKEYSRNLVPADRYHSAVRRRTANKVLFTELDSNKVFVTLERLTARINERFPASGLVSVSRQLGELDRQRAGVLATLQRPMIALRAFTAVGLLALAGLVVLIGSVLMGGLTADLTGWSNFLQTLESVGNEVIFVAVAMLFVGNLEARYKRRMALRSLHSLRCAAHVIDMHQLTKDPVVLLSPAYRPSASSPQRSKSEIELARYLEYCCELLAILGKLGALHLQYLDDPVVFTAVSELETLTQGMANKIWQKIMLFDFIEFQDDHAKLHSTERSIASSDPSASRNRQTVPTKRVNRQKTKR